MKNYVIKNDGDGFIFVQAITDILSLSFSKETKNKAKN